MRSASYLIAIAAAFCLDMSSAFAPRPVPGCGQELMAVTPSIVSKTSSCHILTTATKTPATASAVAAAIIAANNLPLVAMAEDDGDYVYGAVDAPPLVPIIGGILAILTAALPVLLRSGEEAFEEMKEQDGFGSGRDQLQKRK